MFPFRVCLGSPRRFSPVAGWHPFSPRPRSGFSRDLGKIFSIFNGISLNSATLGLPLAFPPSFWEFTEILKKIQRRKALDTSTRSALRSGTGVQPRGWTPVPDLRADLVLVSNAFRRWIFFKISVNSQKLGGNAKGNPRVAEFNEIPLKIENILPKSRENPLRGRGEKGCQPATGEKRRGEPRQTRKGNMRRRIYYFFYFLHNFIFPLSREFAEVLQKILSN